MLFPSFDVQEVHAFRVSRLGDVEIDEDVSDSLLAAVEDEVEARPYKPVVRIEVQESMPREVRAHLLRELRSERGTDSAVLSRGDVYEVDGPLDLRAFAQIADLDLPGERYPSVRSAASPGAGPLDLRAAGRGRRPRAPPLRLLRRTPWAASSRRPPTIRPWCRSSSRSTAPAGSRPSPPPCVDALRNGKEVGRLRGAQGALRRGEQHPLDAPAHRGGRTRRLRAGGLQDARQDRARGSPGGGGPAPLRAHRHRQLQRGHGALLHGPRPAFGRPGAGRRPQRLLQRAHGLGRTAQPRRTAGCGWRRHSLAPNLLRCIEREAEHARAGQAGAHPGEDERDHGPQDR